MQMYAYLYACLAQIPTQIYAHHVTFIKTDLFLHNIFLVLEWQTQQTERKSFILFYFTVQSHSHEIISEFRHLNESLNAEGRYKGLKRSFNETSTRSRRDFKRILKRDTVAFQKMFSLSEQRKDFFKSFFSFL